MIWFPAAFLAGNVSFEPVDDSSAGVTLTDHGQTGTGALFFDKQGRLTDFVAQRYRTPGASSPETWSTPITGYGEFEGLRLPARGKAGSTGTIWLRRDTMTAVPRQQPAGS